MTFSDKVVVLNLKDSNKSKVFKFNNSDIDRIKSLLEKKTIKVIDK